MTKDTREFFVVEISLDHKVQHIRRIDAQTDVPVTVGRGSRFM